MADYRYLAALAVAATVWGTGCGRTDACSTSSDCFQGESCIDGSCVIGGNNGSGNNGSVNNGGNNGSANNGANNGSTGGNNGSTGSNNPTSGNNGILGVCQADPFTAMCADPGDEFYEYVRTETGRDCLGGFDDFEGGTFTLENQQMCAREAVDKYNTNLIPCDSKTFIVEVIVKPHQPCSQDDWDLNVRLQGNDCEVTNDKMRCENLDDGSKRATGFLEPSNSVTSPYIDITPLIQDMQFDYDLTITVRE